MIYALGLFDKMKRNSRLLAFLSLTCLRREVPTLSEPRRSVVTQFPFVLQVLVQKYSISTHCSYPLTYTKDFAFLCENAEVWKIPTAPFWSLCMSLGLSYPFFHWLVETSLAICGRIGLELAPYIGTKTKQNKTKLIYIIFNTVSWQKIPPKSCRQCEIS